jgi:hypothetical protein
MRHVFQISPFHTIIHEWILSYSNSGESACKHGPLNVDREKGWLKKGSAPHKALREIVMNKRLLDFFGKYALHCWF